MAIILPFLKLSQENNIPSLPNETQITFRLSKVLYIMEGVDKDLPVLGTGAVLPCCSISFSNSFNLAFRDNFSGLSSCAGLSRTLVSTTLLFALSVAGSWLVVIIAAVGADNTWGSIFGLISSDTADDTGLGGGGGGTWGFGAIKGFYKEKHWQIC